jgi:hypothetical protein
MADPRSGRVAEIVESGLEGLSGTPDPSVDSLSKAFLAVADNLASAQIGAFTRSLESVQESSPEAVALRQKVAADMHRDGAAIVTAGGEAAAVAFVLAGKGDEEARSEVGWEMRSFVSDGMASKGLSSDELLALANRNYVAVASVLSGLGTGSSASDFVTLGVELLGVVQFAVAGVVEVRADEESN